MLLIIQIEVNYYVQVSGRRKALNRDPIVVRAWRNMWEKEDVPVEAKNESKDENEYICGLR